MLGDDAASAVPARGNNRFASKQGEVAAVSNLHSSGEDDEMPVNLLSINTSVGCERDAGERTRPCCEIKSTSSLLFRLPPC